MKHIIRWKGLSGEWQEAEDTPENRESIGKKIGVSELAQVHSISTQFQGYSIETCKGQMTFITDI